MPVHIRHKINVSLPGLKKANPYLAQELRRAGFHIGDRLQENVRKIQRKDTGQERRRTVYKVTQKRQTNILVSVFNTVIQALVDETGAKPHFPPYKKGTKLFKWVIRKGLAQTARQRLGGGQRRAIAAVFRSEARRGGATPEEAKAAGRQAVKDTESRLDKQAESVAFLIARSISRRGLPRPGDPLRKPFETTRKNSDNMVRTIFNFAVLKAVKRVNDEGKR